MTVDRETADFTTFLARYPCHIVVNSGVQWKDLSPRRRKVAATIALRGGSAKDLARYMHCSVHTIKHHMCKVAELIGKPYQAEASIWITLWAWSRPEGYYAIVAIANEDEYELDKTYFRRKPNAA